MPLRILILTGLLASGMCVPAAADDAPAPANAAQITRWIEQLDHSRYSMRQAAARELADSGSAAVAPLQKAARSGSLEASMLAVSVLRKLADEIEGETAEQAIAALEELSRSRLTAAGNLASKALAGVRVKLAQRAAERFAELGGLYGNYNRTGGEVTTSHAVLSKSWQGRDADLRLLQLLKDVEMLSIHSVPITDAAAPHLRELTHLKRLELYGTRLSPQAALELQSALPTVDVDVRRGALLGVSGSPSNPLCQFSSVREGSAADQAGLMQGDVVVRCEGKPISNFSSLTAVIATKVPGDELKLEILRGGQRKDVTVKLGQWGQ